MPSNILSHGGYYAEFGYDDSADALCGRVLGINDVIDFYASDVTELKAAFIESITEYEEWCREEKTQPQKAWSGKMTIRPTNEQHRLYQVAAAATRESLNNWMLKVLDRESSEVVKRQAVEV